MPDCPTYIPLEEARRIVLDRVRTLPEQVVSLADALGLTLARDVRCDMDAPPFDRAMMDGYAVRSADIGPAGSAHLRVVGQIAAGADWNGQIGPGEAVQINTGALMPPGADAVVPVEVTECPSDGRTVAIGTACSQGQHISRRATHVAAGDVVLKRGTRLGPLQIATAAAAGAGRLTVHRRPEVAVLTTGDELVDPEQVPTGTQVRNVNGPGLVALLTAAGVTARSLGNVGDDAAEMERRVREGLACDMLLLTGGVSMGAFDCVPDVLNRVGVQFCFRKMRTKPAKPTAFGLAPGGKYVFALPGNPVSAFVGFWLLVEPALAAMQGRASSHAMMQATLDGEMGSTGERRSFHPASVRIKDGRAVAKPLSWAGSSDPFGMAGANAMVSQPENAPAAASGDSIELLPIDAF